MEIAAANPTITPETPAMKRGARDAKKSRVRARDLNDRVGEAEHDEPDVGDAFFLELADERLLMELFVFDDGAETFGVRRGNVGSSF